MPKQIVWLMFLILGLSDVGWGQQLVEHEMIVEKWSPLSQQWEPERRRIQQRSPQGQTYTIQEAQWRPTTEWQVTQQWQREYDEKGQLLREQQRATTGLQDIQEQVKDYIRDPQGRILTLKTSISRPARTVDSIAYHYANESDSHPQSVSYYQLTNGKLTWQYRLHYLYIYDHQGRLVYQRTERETPGNAQRIREAEYYHRYDDGRHQVRRLTIRRSPIYEAVSHITAYSSSGQQLSTWQAIRHHPTGPWHPLSETAFRYNDAGQLLARMTYSQWSDSQEDWTRRHEEHTSWYDEAQPAYIQEASYQQVGEVDQLLHEVHTQYTYDLHGRLESYTRQGVDANHAATGERVRYHYPDRTLGYRANHLQVFPNPTQGELHINLSTIDATQGRIRVLDLAGRAHTEHILPFPASDILHLPLTDLASGHYILELKAGNEPFYASFVKE